MVEFLTDEWIDALAAAASARAAPDTDGLDDNEDVVVEYRVVGGDSPSVAYHVCCSNGTLAIAKGPASHPHVALVTDRATARAIARSELSAQAAFLAGRVRVEGDAMALVRYAPAFTALEGVFADVRARTSY